MLTSHLLTATARDEHGVERLPRVVGHLDFDSDHEHGLSVHLDGRDDVLHHEADRLRITRLALTNHTCRHANAPLLVRLHHALSFFCRGAEGNNGFKLSSQGEFLGEGRERAGQEGQGD